MRARRFLHGPYKEACATEAVSAWTTYGSWEEGSEHVLLGTTGYLQMERSFMEF